MVLALSASEGVATSAGAVLVAVALVLWYGRGYRPRWGLHWLAAAFALSGGINLSVGALRWGTPDLGSPGYLLTAVLGMASIGALVVGLLQFVGLGPARPLRAAALAVAVFLLVALAGRGLGLGMLSSSIATSLLFVGLATACLRAASIRPVVGAWLLVATLLVYPAVVVLAVLLGLDPLDLRLWTAVPYALVGLGLLVVALLRYHQELTVELRRREQAEAELRQLNASLEQRIEERTVELRDMVGGLESFNRMVSHDLRGPLGGLAGLTTLAEQAVADGNTPRAAQMLGLMQAETGRLVELVGDLLTLARVSHAELELRPTALDSVLDEALQSLAVSRGAEALAHIVREPLPQARADRSLLRQVFVNLLSNALKFSAGRADLQVRVRADPAAQEVVVEVLDNGVGFPPERAAELFKPFARLHGAQFDGTGVGLTIVRRIVERHGGRVWAVGRPGQGASFFFSLPA